MCALILSIYRIAEELEEPWLRWNYEERRANRGAECRSP